MSMSMSVNASVSVRISCLNDHVYMSHHTHIDFTKRDEKMLLDAQSRTHIFHIGHCRHDTSQHREQLTHLHTPAPTDTIRKPMYSCDRKCQFIRGNSRFFISSFHMLNLPLFFCSSSSFLSRHLLVKAQSWRKKIYSNRYREHRFCNANIWKSIGIDWVQSIWNVHSSTLNKYDVWLELNCWIEWRIVSHESSAHNSLQKCNYLHHSLSLKCNSAFTFFGDNSIQRKNWNEIYNFFNFLLVIFFLNILCKS